MNIKFIFFITLFVLFFQTSNAQTTAITGVVKIDGEPVEFAQVLIGSERLGAVTNNRGIFTIKAIPYGDYQITASYIGYARLTKHISIEEDQSKIQLDFDLTEPKFQLNEIVITGTKTFKRQTNSPVIVNVINSQMIENVQACNLSESLKFQPGLRVETDCQTCNYTQLRMNGLAGGYSQILINGRPLFSPLTGLYGMEQIPANMIERIEVVRGGGSSLYGSSAIGGTVNVITKIPEQNSYELDYNYQNIARQTNDNIVNGNATMLSKNQNMGISLFLNLRKRGFYDANGDNFSEIPLLKNTAWGANIFFLPSKNQKLELNISHIHEYRYGGEMVLEKPAFHTQQAEERTHKVWMASADYQLNFNNKNTSLITYFAWQKTDRKHYTGIQPDKYTSEYQRFLINPPYGTSDVSTYNIGTQLNHRINNFLSGKNVLTVGVEYIYDDVFDEIPAYLFLINQKTKDLGLFLQSDWEVLPLLTLFSGLRIDHHNLVDKAIFSPRVSLLYKLEQNMQLRFSYGTGFRAPQAFDTDLHIAFAGGGISRVALSPDLEPEKSQSFSTSLNYDKLTPNWAVGFTLEGFYTHLENPFYLQPVGEDRYGERFEKQNGNGAVVKGITLELRANHDQKLQLEGGFTLQSSQFNKPVEYIAGLKGIREFTRTPTAYGYSILTFTPNQKWNAALNYVYTGSMKVPHFAGAPNQTVDEISTSSPFSELSLKLSYIFRLEKLGSRLEFYGGIKNIFNAYQDDFDIEKNRDSNYIYGPAQPRTFFIGVKLRSR